jgi:hypothetical protein
VTGRPSSYPAAVWSWAEHLRHGGSTPWTRWVAQPTAGTGTPPEGWPVPGAASLELLRRAASTARDNRLDPSAFAAVADLLLHRSGPGRGLAQQPLVWPGERRRFGPPPVDPAHVPVEELVRAGVGVLTELLLAGPTPAEPAAVRRPLWPRTPGFVLAGPPVSTAVVRRELGALGHVEGGRDPRVLLLVEPFDRMLFEIWSARVQRGAPVRWGGFLTRWSGRRTLPPAADLPSIARDWAQQVGRDHVHLVSGEPSADALADLAGLRPGRAARRVPAGPRDLAPEGVDVLRRVNGVLHVRVDTSQREALAGMLAGRLETLAPGSTLSLPARFRDWASQRARRLADDLRADGYPVHGDLETLVPRWEARPVRPRRSAVLELVVRAALDQAAVNAQIWTSQTHTKEPSR